MSDKGTGLGSGNKGFSPYEDDVMRLIVEKKGRLKELQEKLPKENGFLRKRMMKKELNMVKDAIAYLEKDIERYKRGVSWNRKTSIDSLGTT